jgi:hypothetical protein
VNLKNVAKNTNMASDVKAAPKKINTHLEMKL